MRTYFHAELLNIYNPDIYGFNIKEKGSIKILDGMPMLKRYKRY